MTPEEHEAYIARLEREAEQMNAWQRDRKGDNLIVWIFLIFVATGVLCYFL